MFKGRTSLVIVIATVFSLVLCAGMSSAASKRYRVTGNLRGQIGDGLPLPVILTAPPNGAVLPLNAGGPDGAVLSQTTGVDPKRVTVQPNQFTAKTKPQVGHPVYLFNSAVFSVVSRIGAHWPGNKMAYDLDGIVGGPQGTRGSAVFYSGGRTGASVTSPTVAAAFPGSSVKYTKTGNQFGGTAHSRVSGEVTVWAPAPGVIAPCAPGPTCIAVKIFVDVGADPPEGNGPTTIGGGPFGNTTIDMPVAIAPGIFVAGVATDGSVYFKTPTPSGNAAPTNQAHNWVAPWTTGRITVKATKAKGSPETFILSGSDGRVDGIGSLSLVTGAVSTRQLTGPNANRGWLNLWITHEVEIPALPSWGFPMLAMLLLGVGIALTSWKGQRRSSATG
jgi:hypothetical protein